MIFIIIEKDFHGTIAVVDLVPFLHVLYCTDHQQVPYKAEIISQTLLR